MYLIFDTETNGLPKDYKASAEDSNAWPRVIQLAWELWEENTQGIPVLVEQRAEFIKPDGWVVPKEKFWIDKGYSTEYNDLHGVPLVPFLQEFIERRTNAKYSIGHNISFDSKILRAEMFRYGMTTEFKAEKICTMMKSTKYCGLFSDKSNKFKWLKLEELHNKLFGCNFEGAHNAAGDVAATAKCFFELKKRGVITA